MRPPSANYSVLYLSMITCHPVEPYLGRSLLDVAAHGNGEGQRDDNTHGGMNLSPRAVHTLSVFQGVYGNKVATLERFKENYKTKLSDEIRQRLVLENDEVSYLQISFFPIFMVSLDVLQRRRPTAGL